jgi:two-component system LytT family response regulator
MIVEDEAPARATLRELVEADPDVHVVGETWGERAVAEIDKARPDILFLDVRMPRMDGFDVLAGLQVMPPPVVVFVTAYDEHAVEAFDVSAIDYVLKPFTDERLRSALDRAKERIRSEEVETLHRRIVALSRRDRRLPMASLAPSHHDRIVLEDGSGTLVLPASAISWIEASGPYVVIHAEGREHLVRASLASMEERLADRGFIRVHRSAVVGLSHVRRVRPLSHGDAVIVLDDGTKVKLSRSRREGVEAALNR